MDDVGPGEFAVVASLFAAGAVVVVASVAVAYVVAATDVVVFVVAFVVGSVVVVECESVAVFAGVGAAFAWVGIAGDCAECTYRCAGENADGRIAASA